jgi:MYXO-CTERM domain-containing protein
MSFSHASVGGNIWDGLNRLATNSSFSFPNWTDNARGNPGWQEKVTQFESFVATHASNYDVFQNKFCYIDQDASFTTYRDSMADLTRDYPSKTFVFWTMPLQTSGADNAVRQAFNVQVRAHCEKNDLPLFDIADIESHKTNGAAVTESGNEALDPDQSSDGGHLNELGATRAAAAQWALMAQIANHSGSGSSGGTSSTGGSSAGGSSASGGTNSTGGSSASASGGTNSTGGSSASASGGTNSTGGSSASASGGTNVSATNGGQSSTNGGQSSTNGGQSSANAGQSSTNGGQSSTDGGATESDNSETTTDTTDSNDDSGCSFAPNNPAKGWWALLALAGFAFRNRRKHSRN